MIHRVAAAAVAGIIGLGGCAALREPGAPEQVRIPAATPAPGPFLLSGRIAVRRGEQPFSGSVRWRHVPGRDEILFSSPLGQGVADIVAVPGEVVLRTSDSEHRAADVEALTEQALGWRLPLAGLVHWVGMTAAPGSEAKVTRTGTGDVARLEQDGWVIEYARYEAVGKVRLPRKVIARREDLEIRLVVDEWQLAGATP